MHPRALTLTLALLITFSAYGADNLRIDQVSPDSRTWITATLVPTWCSVAPPKVEVSGNRVSITVESLFGVCIATFAAIPITANIGVLPGGTYDVVLTGSGVKPSETTLVVRGVDPFRIIPMGGPTSGSAPVLITVDPQSVTQAPFISAKSVMFGDKPATIVQAFYSSIEVAAPPHAAGDVDVTFTVTTPPPDSATQTFTSRVAYRYYDSAAAPDPFVFEPILYPIAFRGIGAYGSNWTTENVIAVQPWIFATFWRSPCAECPVLSEWHLPRVPVALDPISRDSGILLYADRGTSRWVYGSSRIHDLSRQGQSAGVEIPILRERDFRSDLQLVNIPTDGRFRAMLRIWSLDDLPNGQVSITVTGDGTGLESFVLKFSPRSSDALPFASADLTPILQKYADRGTISLAPSSSAAWPPLWAMVSVTNNDTQEVTLVTPQ